MKESHNKRKRIVTLGEIMLRLSPEGNKRIMQADRFEVCFGGGEANAAVLLSGLGFDSEFVTAIPDNAIGDRAVAELRKYGVSTEHISRKGPRLGIYYMEPGSSVRPSNVIYDRAGSSIALARPEDFDLDEIFDKADWFHFTGITPALSEDAALLTEAALQAAKAKGVTVSVDLNYRKKLWTEEKAREVMSRLMQYVDVCIGNEEDAEKVLGFACREGAADPEEAYRDMFGRLCDAYGFRYVISSFRQSRSASDNDWSGFIMDGETREFFHSRTYRLTPIADRIGGGDSFAAGCICGFLDGRDMKETLSFAVAASALKHTIPGDFDLISREEAEELMTGGGLGRVKR